MIDSSLKYKKIQSNIKNIANLQILNIPDEYETGSILYLANLDLQNDKNFYKIYDLLSPKYASLQIDQDNIKNGIFRFITKDGVKYNVKAVPFFVLNLDDQIICYSWINSLYLSVPYFNKQILHLQKLIANYTKNIPYLNYECFKGFGYNKKSDMILTDILVLTRYLLKGKGYFLLSLPNMKERKDYESIEYFMITSIDKI